MSVGKLLLLIGALALAGLVLWGGVVAVWVFVFGKGFAKDTQAVLAEGDAAGRALDAEGCVSTALTRVETCRFYNLKCRFRQQFFLQGCLQSSRARREYCEQVPPFTQFLESMRFRKEECAKRQQSGSKGCEQLLQAAQMFCQSIKDESAAK